MLANKQNTLINQRPYIRSESVYDELVSMTKSYNESYMLNIRNGKCSFISNDGESVLESTIPSVMTESTSLGYNRSKEEPIIANNESFNLNVVINKSGIIESAVTEAANTVKMKSKVPSSLRESFRESVLHEEDIKLPKALGNLNPPNGIMQHSPSVSKDGLIIDRLDDKDYKKFEVNTPGAVIKKLKRHYVIPCYIEETCMGNYYIELRTKDLGDDLMGFRNILGDPLTGTSAEGRINFNNVENNRQEETLKYICGQLSQFIDKEFVNSNQDLSKEIYEILKYNDLFNTPSLEQIKITFVPPEDIFHFYFKLDQDSKRGISDLARGLIPAKVYASMWVTNAIGIMTRGQDKRVYYVNQLVDTNVSQQLLNVISQIKMGNFGIRQFNSINNILNITGKFNDHVIPRGPGGQSPIDIDVIQGQQFDVHTDFMEILHDMAVSSTDVPLDIIQSRKSLDYASQISMSSSKFLRTVYKRQEKFQKDLSPFISAIYNYEYDDNVSLDVALPPPIFLDMVNTNQLITNTKEYVESWIDIEMQNEENENLKTTYRKNLFKHYIGTHIDAKSHADILARSKAEIKLLEKESEKQAEEPPDDNSGGGDYDNW